MNYLKYTALTLLIGLTQSLTPANRETFDPFFNVAGMTEHKFKSLTNQQKKALARSNSFINNATGKKWKMGTVSITSIDELRAKAARVKKGSGCTFNVIEGYDEPWNSWFRDKVDITALQAAPENKDAVFQVASNFNGLEGTGDPASGITPYLSPGLYVQGEAAALSAMPGIIYRMYFMPHVVNGKTYYGQLNQQLNLLEQFSSGPFTIPIHNGYIGHLPNIDAFANLTDAQLKALAGKVNIAFHSDIQVSSGLGPLKNELPHFTATKVNDQTQVINQIFAAALNPYHNNTQSKGFKNLAQMLLCAAYEGALKSAYVNGKKKIYLTLIGGGVFENKLSWITHALESAVSEFADTGDMEINLVIYSSTSYKQQDAAAWHDFENRMTSLVRKTGGQYMQYKKSGASLKKTFDSSYAQSSRKKCLSFWKQHKIPCLIGIGAVSALLLWAIMKK